MRPASADAKNGTVQPPLARRTTTITPFRVVDVMEAAWAAERAGRSIVHLEVGEPDFGTPEPVVEAAGKAIADGRVRYTSSLGIPELREAISGYYADRFGVDVPARRVVVTTGASGALLLALAATVDRDHEVLLADPGYPCNRNLIRLCEGVPVGIPVGADTDYQLTAALVAGRWTARTWAVLLATPSNPTGTVVPPGELAAIAAGAADRGGVCFVDEIYGELVYDRPPATVLASTDTSFVVNSFSKTFGMTGWRLGWMVCPDWALAAVEALSQNAFISPPPRPSTAGSPPSPPKCGRWSTSADGPSPPGGTRSSPACATPASVCPSCRRAPSTSTPAPTASTPTACAWPAACSTRPASPPSRAATSAITSRRPICASPTRRPRPDQRSRPPSDRLASRRADLHEGMTMGILDKVKEQATHLKDSDKVREVAQKVKGKVEDVQTRRKANDLLADLGRLLYAQQTGRTNATAEAEIARFVAELRALEDDGLTVLPDHSS